MDLPGSNMGQLDAVVPTDGARSTGQAISAGIC